MPTLDHRRLSVLVLLDPGALDALAKRVGPPAVSGVGAEESDALDPTGGNAALATGAPGAFEIRVVRAPAPASVLAAAARDPWCADFLSAAIAAHAEHVEVAVSVAPGASPVAAATWLGVRAHAVVRAYAASVVVWGGVLAVPAGLFGERYDAFRSAPPTERELPVELWIDTGLARTGETVSARTRGLASLGRPEVEVAPLAAELEDTRELVLELALHLVENAPGAWPVEGSIAGELGGVALAVRRTPDVMRLEPTAPQRARSTKGRRGSAR